MKGQFVISLDLELMWGVHHFTSIEKYGKKILNAREVFPFMLNLFDQHNVKVTFAIVGMLFFKDSRELLKHLPSKIPTYKNKHLSAYNHLKENNERLDDLIKMYFGQDIIANIINNGNHEIGTHTFSHLMANAEGVQPEDFEADISAAFDIAEKFKIKLKSIVFPVNQYRQEHVEICQKKGLISFRGVEPSGLYTSGNSGFFKKYFFKLRRFLDSYIDIEGNLCSSLNNLSYEYGIVNIPASRFLRPYSKRLSFFEFLKIRRVKKQMTFAAKHSKVFHLWWHPHNFGSNVNDNLNNLIQILKHFQMLQEKYDFQSSTMADLANSLLIQNRQGVHQEQH